MNEMYSDNDKQYYELLPNLCSVCGIKAPFKCSRCKVTWYCCRLHQTHHWHNGGHKKVCTADGIKVSEGCTGLSVTLPEHEIFIEPEPARENEEKVVVEDLPKLESFSAEQTVQEETDKQLEKEIKRKKDPVFKKFLKRIKRCPSQIIRYQLGAADDEILWPTHNGKPNPDDIPMCQYCGSKRQFEFQVMPQLLTYLNLRETIVEGDGVDWATLAVYTCSNNCMQNPDDANASQPFCAREIVLKLDYPETK